MQHALLHNDWRLIWRPNVTGHEPINTLYDLSSDPDSLDDLSNENPERVRAMRELIRLWIKDGSARRPELVPAMAGTNEMLRGIGYIEGEE